MESAAIGGGEDVAGNAHNVARRHSPIAVNLGVEAVGIAEESVISEFLRQIFNAEARHLLARLPLVDTLLKFVLLHPVVDEGCKLCVDGIVGFLPIDTRHEHTRHGEQTGVVATPDGSIGAGEKSAFGNKIAVESRRLAVGKDIAHEVAGEGYRQTTSGQERKPHRLSRCPPR